MVTITKKELEIDNELKKKIKFICSLAILLLLLSMVILEKLIRQI